MLRRLTNTIKIDFNDVLIVPQRSSIGSRKFVDIEKTFKFKYSKDTWKGVPIISSNMDSVTNLSTVDVLAKRNWLSCIPKYMNKTLKSEILDKKHNFILSCGLNDYYDLFKILIDEDYIPKFICLDVANGYISEVVELCSKIRENFPDSTLIAGNVVTPDAVEELITVGNVDIVKIGIGSGALCTTRKVTGVGYPQLSAIIECAEVAHNLGGHIISDGGIVTSGDMCKAFAAGADFVMVGSLLAGHDVSPGIKTLVNGEFYKHVYGMSSEHANNKHFGGLKQYKAAEGRSLKIPYKGDLDRTLNTIEGGIRSACSYVGSPNIDGLKNAKFILVSQQYNTSLEKYDNQM
jgi:GMP reductase